MVKGKENGIIIDGIPKDSIYIISDKTKTKIPVSIRFSGGERRYLGDFKISLKNNELFIVNIIGVEDYLIGVLAGEFAQASTHALEAQAVLSRTLVYSKMLANQKESFDLGDLTNDQAYSGFVSYSRFRDAINQTKDLVMTYQNKLIEPFWFSTCGNRFITPDVAWGGEKLAYLRHKNQPILKSEHKCRKSPHFYWERKLPIAMINELFKPKYRYEIYQPYPFIQADKVFILENKWLYPEHFRLKINRRLGWNFIKSNDYQMTHFGAYVQLKGYGLGHNIGLCQCEAEALSQAGIDFQQILEKYYVGIVLKPFYQTPEFLRL